MSVRLTGLVRLVLLPLTSECEKTNSQSVFKN
jgi:hypothetical protein